ncbi:hypothetical protein [Botrimarina sp.]|uniref:hypothetical protein n=1 Tax=Botrimarina sp. TaxID=2795802 RepID=UPI0032EDD9D6
MATAERPTADATTRPLPKDDLISVLQAQPADSTYDELIRELLLRREVRLAMKEVDEGRVLTSEEMRQEIDSWRK